MLLFQSIIVYTLFAWLLAYNAKLSIRDNTVQVHNYGLPKHLWICLFIFAFISGIRWYVGVDYPSYLFDYGQMLNGNYQVRSRGIELGFLWLSKLCATLKLHYTLYFAMFASLQIYFILLAFKQRRYLLPTMLVVLIMGGYYFSMMNGIRQQLVACSFIWATKFIIEKKKVHYLIWVAIAYQMHHSVLLLVPTYFLVYDKTKWNKMKLNILVFVFCFFMGNTPYWIGKVMVFSDVLTWMGYDNYLSNLTDADTFRSFNFGPRMIVVLSTYIFCIINYNKVSLYFKDRAFDLYFKLFMIGCCGYYLFINTTLVFLRPIEYFTIFALPVCAYTLIYLKRKNALYFYVMAFCAMAFTFLSCYADNNVIEEERRMQLFQFCFDHWNGI